MATSLAPPVTQWGSTFNEFTHAAPSLMAKLQMFAGVSDVQRVSQLDADVFDREIVSMMKVQLNRMFAFKPGVVETNQLEIDTALRGLVFVLSTLRNEPTPGMQLLDLKFGTIRKGIWGAPSVGQRLAYGLLTTVGPFLWVKIRGAAARAHFEQRAADPSRAQGGALDGASFHSDSGDEDSGDESGSGSDDDRDDAQEAASSAEEEQGQEEAESKSFSAADEADPMPPRRQGKRRGKRRRGGLAGTAPARGALGLGQRAGATLWAVLRSALRSVPWYRLLARVETLIVIASLANTLSFLRHGVYRGLAERLLGLQLVHASEPRSRFLNFDYMTRNLLWKTLTDFLLFAAPAVPWSLLGRGAALVSYMYGLALATARPYALALVLRMLGRGRVSRLLGDNMPLRGEAGSAEKSLPSSSGGGGKNSDDVHGESKGGRQRQLLDLGPCAVCNATPHMPFRAGCQHVFCYYCLESARQDDSRFACPRCGVQVRYAERVGGGPP